MNKMKIPEFLNFKLLWKVSINFFLIIKWSNHLIQASLKENNKNKKEDKEVMKVQINFFPQIKKKNNLIGTKKIMKS